MPPDTTEVDLLGVVGSTVVPARLNSSTPASAIATPSVAIAEATTLLASNSIVSEGVMNATKRVAEVVEPARKQRRGSAVDGSRYNHEEGRDVDRENYLENATLLGLQCLGVHVTAATVAHGASPLVVRLEVQTNPNTSSIAITTCAPSASRDGDIPSKLTRGTKASGLIDT